MNLITLENIYKSYSEKSLLENISLGINEGDKIGIIGINGTGKSTLLKIIAGVEECDSGKITKGNKVRIEYLSQKPDFKEEATVLEQVFRGNSDEMKTLREYQFLLDEINNGKDNVDKLMEVQGRVDSLNLWELESEAKKVLTRLGITNFSEKVCNLSGGQKKRIALASALITPSDLLILDEPTNHMDNDTISFLEEYLTSIKGALITITHDRYFLDNVTNRIIEIDRGEAYSYDGNYSIFLEKKIERMENEKAREDKKQSLIKSELKWVKRGAKARTTKQKARLERFDDLVNSVENIRRETLDISVASTRLGKKIISIEDITKSFGDKTLIKDFSYTLLRSDRVGIIGENGAGKSTLMKLINREIPLTSGKIDIGETVRIGYFSQESESMDENMRAIDYIKETAEFIENAEGIRISASQMCERFLFDGTLQYSKIEKLSGGEKRRLYLLKILATAPNVLLLDEPTNDLDIETLNILEDYLDEFQGAVITVSHDRYFLDRICNKIFSYEGGGLIKQYPGNYSDYLLRKEIEDIRLESSRVETIKVEKPREKREKQNDKKLKFSYKEQREFETIDSDIENIENFIADVDNKMAKASTDYTRLQELTEEKEKLENMLSEKYERWEYLNNLAEEIEKNKAEVKNN